MTTIDFDRFLAQLSTTSEHDPIDPAQMEWPASVDPAAWYFSPELISLYDTAVWHAMNEAQQKRLSFFEAVNFFSLNIHGEKYLVSEISHNLFDGEESELSRYLLHFVEEETRHMMYFSGFCQRYANRIYPDRTMHSEPSGDPELDRFMLFARINVFEEIVDHYNKTMAADERLAPVAREINRIHHHEELRHLAFGRRFLADCLERHVDSWDDERRGELRRQLSAYVDYVWKQYYNPDVYQDAGVANAFDSWREVGQSDTATRYRMRINSQRFSYLRKLEILEVA
jgi:hypothetical protein